MVQGYHLHSKNGNAARGHHDQRARSITISPLFPICTLCFLIHWLVNTQHGMAEASGEEGCANGRDRREPTIPRDITQPEPPRYSFLFIILLRQRSLSFSRSYISSSGQPDSFACLLPSTSLYLFSCYFFSLYSQQTLTTCCCIFIQFLFFIQTFFDTQLR